MFTLYDIFSRWPSWRPESLRGWTSRRSRR